MIQVYTAEGKTVEEAVGLLTQPCCKWSKPLGPADIVELNGAFTAYITIIED